MCERLESDIGRERKREHGASVVAVQSGRVREGAVSEVRQKYAGEEAPVRACVQRHAGGEGTVDAVSGRGGVREEGRTRG